MIKPHIFNYMITIYRYFNIQSWDIDHSTQHEIVILIIYKCNKEQDGAQFFQIGVTSAKFWPLLSHYKIIYEMYLCTQFSYGLYEDCTVGAFLWATNFANGLKKEVQGNYFHESTLMSSLQSAIQVMVEFLLIFGKTNFV